MTFYKTWLRETSAEALAGGGGVRSRAEREGGTPVRVGGVRRKARSRIHGVGGTAASVAGSVRQTRASTKRARLTVDDDEALVVCLETAREEKEATDETGIDDVGGSSLEPEGGGLQGLHENEGASEAVAEGSS